MASTGPAHAPVPGQRHRVAGEETREDRTPPFLDLDLLETRARDQLPSAVVDHGLEDVRSVPRDTVVRAR